MKLTRTTSIISFAALALVACGSGGGNSTATTAAAVTTTPSTVGGSTAPTTAGSTAPSSAGSTVSPTTTIPADPVMPLTGLPITDPAAAGRGALVVKIDNHPIARPQSGLNEADIVFEENVEELTRFAAVFQSNGSDPVGPIRSGRTQDVDLLGSLNKPIFAWSGGNARVSAAINGSDLVPVNETKAGKAMFRNKNS